MSDVIAGNFNTHITNFICGLLDIYKVYETTLRLAFFLHIFSSTQSVGSLDIFYVPFQNFLNPSKRTATIGPLFGAKTEMPDDHVFD